VWNTPVGYWLSLPLAELLEWAALLEEARKG